MKLDEVVQRYSRALFQLEGSKEKRLEMLLRLLDVWKKTPKLLSFLTSPLICNSDKIALLKEAVGEDEKLWAFFNLIIQSHRSKLIPAIIEDYRQRVVENLGTIEMTLCTAVPVDEDEKEKLQKKMEQLHQRPVHIKEKIDPRIIGGAILAFKNKMIDFSVKGRLEMLRKQLCK